MNMLEPVLFQSLTIQQQIELFSQCQKILTENHPISPFIVTKENWLTKQYFALDFIKKYKGYCYWNDKICILFNKVKIEDPRNPIKSLRDHLFKPPRDDYNAYCVDFVAFRRITDSLEFIKSQDNIQTLYILFVKNNEVKLYLKDRLLQRLNASPAHLLGFV